VILVADLALFMQRPSMFVTEGTFSVREGSF
jgi:hypothetical protein